jgi:hypothetical protein
MWKNDVIIFFKYLPEICDFHKEITIFIKKRAILHVDITKNISSYFFFSSFEHFSIFQTDHYEGI